MNFVPTASSSVPEPVIQSTSAPKIFTCSATIEMRLEDHIYPENCRYWSGRCRCREALLEEEIEFLRKDYYKALDLLDHHRVRIEKLEGVVVQAWDLLSNWGIYTQRKWESTKELLKNVLQQE